MPLHAIITAGGVVPRSLKDTVSVSRKALIEVGGRTLLTTAVTAAQECALLDRVVVVGNDEVRQRLGDRAEFVAEGADVVVNIERGFTHLGGEGCDYAVISPDLPLLDSELLRQFLAAARDSCELAAPLVSRGDFLRRFPGARNRFARFAGGLQATMGSCFYFSGPALRANLPLARDCYRYRKYAHRLAVMLGLPIVFAFLFGRLRIEALERRAAQLTGVVVRAIPMSDAGIAYDIDNLENLQYAESLLRGGTES